MCKKQENQNKAIDNFFDKLRGESYGRTFAIYERCDSEQSDLLGFAAFVDDVLNFFRVMPDDSVRVSDMVPYPAMGTRGIAAYFSGDYAVAI